MTELRINTSVRRMRTLKVYHLEPSVSVVPCLSSGIAKEGSFSVSLTLSENNKEKKPYSAYIRYKRCRAGSCSAPIVSKGKVSSIVVDTGKSAGAVFDSYVIEAYEKTTAADKILAVVTVSTVRDGIQGSVGPMLVPNGSWDSKRTYRSTESYRIFVERNKLYFVLHKLNVDCLNVDPALDVKNEYWRLMDYVEYMFVNAMVANFGKIASTVFTGDYTISQHGVSKGVDSASGLPYDYKDFTPDMSKFEPNIVIDWLTGVIHALSMHIAGDSTFGGTLDAVTGSFCELNGLGRVYDQTLQDYILKVVAKLYFDSSELIIAGFDKISLRALDAMKKVSVYSDDFMCLGRFSAMQRTMYVVDGLSCNIYYKADETPLQYHVIEETIVCHEFADELGYLCADEIVFSGNYNNTYYLNMAQSQRVMLFNKSTGIKTIRTENGEKSIPAGGMAIALCTSDSSQNLNYTEGVTVYLV